MAASPFTKMPGEIVCAITALLELEDRNGFRLVSRWAERETFRQFATRDFTEVYITKVNCQNSQIMPSRLKVAEKSPQLASAIRVLRGSVKRTRKTDLAMMSSKAFPYGEEDGAGHCKRSTVSYLASKLPHLETLELRYLRGPDVMLHILPSGSPAMSDSGTAWARLRTLSIDPGDLDSAGWHAVIRQMGPTLAELSLCKVCCIDGNWLPILIAMQTNLVALQHLTIENMVQCAPISWSTDLHRRRTLMLMKGDEIRKELEIEGGNEVMLMHGSWAWMRGSQAVRTGLEMIVQYVEETKGFD
ncbi:hypothetical protein LTR27_009631 [Elasticomyces elasticus]|nr:hypothetical protein LTR27_009631 [Elasticomyces elasticus]